MLESDFQELENKVKEFVTEVEYKDKKCSICQKFKRLDEFYKNKRYRGGYMTVCKRCHLTYMSAYQKKNKEQIAVYQKERRKNKNFNVRLNEDGTVYGY
jgi:ribosomal protein S2